MNIFKMMKAIQTREVNDRQVAIDASVKEADAQRQRLLSSLRHDFGTVAVVTVSNKSQGTLTLPNGVKLSVVPVDEYDDGDIFRGRGWHWGGWRITDSEGTPLCSFYSDPSSRGYVSRYSRFKHDKSPAEQLAGLILHHEAFHQWAR